MRITLQTSIRVQGVIAVQSTLPYLSTIAQGTLESTILPSILVRRYTLKRVDIYLRVTDSKIVVFFEAKSMSNPGLNFKIALAQTKCYADTES